MESDSIVRTHSGESFLIQLESNIGTGYRWELEETPDAALITLASREYRAGQGDADNGKPGQDIFTFKANGTGQTTLKFWYVRPWAKDKSGDPNTKRMKYTVQID